MYTILASYNTCKSVLASHTSHPFMRTYSRTTTHTQTHTYNKIYRHIHVAAQEASEWWGFDPVYTLFYHMYH